MLTGLHEIKKISKPSVFDFPYRVPGKELVDNFKIREFV